MENNGLPTLKYEGLSASVAPIVSEKWIANDNSWTMGGNLG